MSQDTGLLLVITLRALSVWTCRSHRTGSAQVASPDTSPAGHREEGLRGGGQEPSSSSSGHRPQVAGEAGL